MQLKTKSLEKCFKCHGNSKTTILISSFNHNDNAHYLCNQCGITFDSDVNDVSTTKLSTSDIQSIAGEQEYRKYFVETSEIRKNGEDYSKFKWNDQTELRNGVVLPVINSITEVADTTGSFNVLDVGSGSGFTAHALANKFEKAQIHTIDPSPQVLQANNINPRVTASQGTLQSLDLEKGSYDVVVIIGNLMLHDDPFSSIEIATSLLKPSGILIIDFKNIRSSIRALCIILNKLRIDSLIPKGLYIRNFVNMRYGFTDNYLIEYMDSLPLKLHTRKSKPPRLLAFDNKSDFSQGWKGIVWRLLNQLDRIRSQQAWIQLTLIKTSSK